MRQSNIALALSPNGDEVGFRVELADRPMVATVDELLRGQGEFNKIRGGGLCVEWFFLLDVKHGRMSRFNGIIHDARCGLHVRGKA